MARMPKYEKLRNQLIRNDRKSFSPALKRNIIVAIINSGFFLWVLSAIFLTFGGSFISKHSDCVSLYRTVSDEFDDLNGEIISRQQHIDQAFHQSEITDQILKAILSSTHNSYQKYSSLSLRELELKRQQLARQILFPKSMEPHPWVNISLRQFVIESRLTDDNIGYDDRLRIDAIILGQYTPIAASLFPELLKIELHPVPKTPA
jgi:hypothetical protein